MVKKSKSTGDSKVLNAVSTAQPQHIGIVAHDPYLEPFEDAIRGRHDHVAWKISQLTNQGKETLSDFANGYQYYGLHGIPRGWVFRE